MKIAALIGGRPQHLYFVNRLHAALGVDLCIVQAGESSGWRGLKNKLRSAAALGSMQPFGAHVPTKIRRRAEARTCRRILGEGWGDLRRDVPVYFAPSVNGEDVVAQLDALKPDALVVHGTAIVKPPVLDTAPLALNVHWGLSPYYRGTNCTEWALIDRDPYNIGVTVHRLAQRIDAGDIVGQARVDVEPGDTALSINLKLTRAGTPIVIEALGGVASGRSLRFWPQDLSRGKLRLNRDWSKQRRREVRRLTRPAALGAMLDDPSRVERLAIVDGPRFEDEQ